VQDFRKAVKLLLGAKAYLIKLSDYEKAIFSFQRNIIHLHGKITWTKGGTTFVDNELIWTEPQTVSINGVQVKIPNPNADLLLHLAHINFESLSIPLSVLLYLYRIGSKIDWRIVFNQARKHRWIRTLVRSLRILDAFHHSLYESPCPFLHCYDLEHEGFNDTDTIFFPFYLPRRHVIWAFFEKKLLIWAIFKRTSRSLRLLVTGK
jgi:hypothetical protein